MSSCKGSHGFFFLARLHVYYTAEVSIAFVQMWRNMGLPTFGQLANKYWEVITVPSGKKDALVWMLYLIAMTRRAPLNMFVFFPSQQHLPFILSV